ncbi:MAG: hypothetical protein ACYC91_00005 [Solirubrobacteraceae bacterium]
MHTTFAIESNESPAPGIVPEPVRVHNQPTVPTGPAPLDDRQAVLRGVVARPRQTVSSVLAKLLRAIRGEKYAAGADSAHRTPPRPHATATKQSQRTSATTPRASAQSPARPELLEAEHAARTGSTTGGR